MRASPCLLCQGLGGRGWDQGGVAAAVLLRGPGVPQNQALTQACVSSRSKGQVSWSGMVETPQGWQRLVLKPVVPIGELMAGPPEPPAPAPGGLGPPRSFRGHHTPAATGTSGTSSQDRGSGEAGNLLISAAPIQIAAEQKAPSQHPGALAGYGPGASTLQRDESHCGKSCPDVSRQSKRSGNGGIGNLPIPALGS